QALATQLRLQGVEAAIVTSFPGPPEIDGIAIDRVAGLRLPWAELAVSPRLVGHLSDCLSAGGYDMVHIHASIVAPFCLAAAPAALGLGLPVEVTFHSVMRTMPRVLSLIDRFAGWSKGNISLSAVSNLVAGQVRCGLPDRQVAILPNGFEQGFWQGEPRDPPAGGPFRIVSAMRLQPRKRPFALIDIFAEASRLAALGGRELSLTIAGEGDLQGPLRRYIATRGVAGSVDLVGWQTPDRLKALYADSSVFVMPSIKEAFCIAALEARASGLPVVAHARTGIADFVTDDVSGILTQSDQKMAQALAALALDGTRLARLSRPDASIARYDWSNLAAEHIRLYRDRLQAGGR
ncbi:MAG: glycosyltransferase family 4 protein, partial [Mesorhizobium sp.]|nr:glycosyltransferase family 4 protein [Mesorhizobium sp.]